MDLPKVLRASCTSFIMHVQKRPRIKGFSGTVFLFIPEAFSFNTRSFTEAFFLFGGRKLFQTVFNAFYSHCIMAAFLYGRKP